MPPPSTHRDEQPSWPHDPGPEPRERTVTLELPVDDVAIMTVGHLLEALSDAEPGGGFRDRTVVLWLTVVAPCPDQAVADAVRRVDAARADTSLADAELRVRSVDWPSAAS